VQIPHRTQTILPKVICFAQPLQANAETVPSLSNAHLLTLAFQPMKCTIIHYYVV
jgi:hypothetical protein